MSVIDWRIAAGKLSGLSDFARLRRTKRQAGAKVLRLHGLTYDRMQRCTATPAQHSYLARRPSAKIARRVTFSQRLVFLIRFIKSTRGSSQPSPSAANSLYAIKSLAVSGQRHIREKNTGAKMIISAV